MPFGDPEAAVAAIDDATAAFIVEPVQGEGGIKVPPPGYLRAIREACDRHGALMIADEVQSGLGRTGKTFAVEHDGVVPDLMTLAKALGGGVMPLGATMGTEAVFSAIYSSNPLHHTSTFGGNNLACAAGLAGLEVLVEEGLVERSARMGAVMKAGLQGIADRHPDMVKEVRGIGLMLGVEMQEDEVGELIAYAQTHRRSLA